MGGIISGEPTPSNSEYPTISWGSPCGSSASRPPTAWTARPMINFSLADQTHPLSLARESPTVVVQFKVLFICGNAYRDRVGPTDPLKLG